MTPPRFDLADTERALSAAHLAFEKKITSAGSPVYLMKYANLKFSLVAYDAGCAHALQLRAGFTSGGTGTGSRAPRLAEVNEWNRDKRMPKAYVDQDGDVVLEQYVLPTGATDPAEVAHLITGPWIASVIQYGSAHH